MGSHTAPGPWRGACSGLLGSQPMVDAATALTSSSPRAWPVSLGMASSAAATHTAHPCRGSAGSRTPGEFQGALRAKQGAAGGQGPSQATLRGTFPPQRGPTCHQQPQGAQQVPPQGAAVVPGVLVAQLPQEQRVSLRQLPCCSLLLHLPQHRGVCRRLVLAGQRDVGSQAAQHRVPRQPWRSRRGAGDEDETPGLVGVPGGGRHPITGSPCPVTAGVRALSWRVAPPTVGYEGPVAGSTARGGRHAGTGGPGSPWLQCQRG